MKQLADYLESQSLEQAYLLSLIIKTGGSGIMLKSIFNAFVSNKAGKLYLTSILILIISNIILSSNSNLYFIGTAAVIFYVIALVYYSRHMEINIWVNILLVALTLVPFGIWMTLIYFARKNYYLNQPED